MALYSVSTRSTLRRRIGAAARAWFASTGRHRAAPAERPRDDSDDSAVTMRIERRSLILHPGVDQETSTVIVHPIPTQRAPRHRTVVYPNAYRAR